MHTHNVNTVNETKNYVTKNSFSTTFIYFVIAEEKVENCHKLIYSLSITSLTVGCVVLSLVIVT
jgi:hypothetical protein